MNEEYSNETVDTGAEQDVQSEEISEGYDDGSGQEVEALPEKPRYKVKVDDQELEVDEDELLRGYQLSKASNRRFEEAARIRKEAEAQAAAIKQHASTLLQGLRESPAETLAALGIDVDDLSESYVANKLQRAMMDPRELELIDTKRKLQEYEQMQQQQQMTYQQQQHQKEVEALSNEFDTKIQQALMASNLPKTPYTAHRVADILLAAAENDIDLDPATVVPQVYQELQEGLGQVASTLSGEALIDFIGPEALARIRKADVARLKNPRAEGGASYAPRPGAQGPRKAQTMSSEEFKNYLKKIQGR